MCNVYSRLIDVLEASNETLHFYVSDKKETVQIKIQDKVINQPVRLFEWEQADQLLLHYPLTEEEEVLLYVKERCVYVVKECRSKGVDKTLFPMKFSCEREDIVIQQDGIASVSITNHKGDTLLRVNDVLTEQLATIKVHADIPFEKDEKRYFLLGKVEMGRYIRVFLYDDYMKRIEMHNILFDRIVDTDRLTITFLNHQHVQFTSPTNDAEKTLCFQKISQKQPMRLFEKDDAVAFENDDLVGLYIINHAKYYVFMRSTGLYVIKNNPKKALRFGARLQVATFGDTFYLYGRMAHFGYNTFGKFDTLYAMDENHPMTTFKRPFRHVRFFKQFGYFKLSAKALDFGENVHYPLYVGSKERPLHPFPIVGVSGENKSSIVYGLRHIGEKVLALRSTIHGQATYSIVPNSPMYGKGNRWKMKAASLISSIFYRNKKKNVNLFFEKQASKADESGFRVFEKVMEENHPHSENYFILDKNANVYSEMKRKHGNAIIDRFSFKHYLQMFNADYFISSDLSNHVINDRIYINEITKKIQKVPLIFLQHGIMFAKPVENPLGKIFYKQYSAYNIHKNVVNSKLEAGEFYKMGYTDKDLWYTGLATFDYAKLNEGTDKIVYMPTYRYWEEGMIYSGDIEKTTYFQSLMKVIEAFEKAGLRDKLVIVSHNKFVEYIYNSMGEYKDMVAENPSEALKVGRIFISDFSSAIYDAIYRGAYPIFYWEDKSYLIDRYGAVPPVNEDNAPGPIALSADQVVEIAKQAIANNYVLEDEYREKYLQINSFNDNRNTERVVEHMKEEGIL